MPVQRAYDALLKGFVAELPSWSAPPLDAFEVTAVVAREPWQVALPHDASLRAGSGDDPAMARYLALDAAERSFGIHVYEPIGTRWWNSEYRSGGHPISFRSNFLLHLTPLDEARTRIEVLEVLPKVLAGKKWTWERHGGIGLVRVMDIRPVPPTVTDCERVLEHALAVLARESER